MITYRIDVADPHAHLYRVTLEVPQPAAEQRLSLPVWIPGSYMVREFGRHLSALRAAQGSREVPLQQLDKTTWLARCSGKAALTISYNVYAFDTSVRTAFLDANRGFFNGTSLCLRVEGREQEPQRVRFGTLPKGWEIATAMPAAGGRGVYEAADYDELVDHPFELGRFWRGEFEAAGVPHEFVVAGALPSFDGERLLADAKRICEAEIAFWHGQGKGADKPPFERYVFMLNAVEDGYGGLEHRASTALIAARRDLPRRGQSGALSDGYVTLLGLISHEYFHTWNVKRLKPADFARLDYTRENYTELLWFFEGFTSYYDDLLLVRAGLIDEARYLKLLGKTLAGVLGTPGRQVQSVAQSSFDAWVKYYRGDENTPNSTISYYTKGSLVALALDLTLRQAKAKPGRPAPSLDRVMRQLWSQTSGGPIGEADVEAALEAVGGRSLGAELQAWVHGVDDLPLAPLLAAVGVELRDETAAGLPALLGLKLSEGAFTGVQVKSVLRGSAAERAGLSAGDEIFAVQGWRVRRLDDALAWLPQGEPFELMVVRDQRVLTLRVTPPDAKAAPRMASLGLAAQAPKTAAALRRAWLQG
jgi:predicted metalloprotease with PDZ domain